MSNFSSNVTALNAVTVDTVSEVIDVSMRKKLSLQLTASGIALGNGVFTVSVSNDGTNFVTYNRLITNATKTNAQTDVGVASVTLNSNTSVMVFFPVGDYFRYLKVSVDLTTDGAYSAVVQAVD
jgi:hypothetical protein